MKNFTIYTVSMLLALIVFVGTGEWMARQVNNSYKIKQSWMDHHAEEAEVLVFGNSHAYYGVRPNEFKSIAFNMAEPSQTLQMDAYLFLRDSTRYKRLNAVLTTLSYTSMYTTELENGPEWHRCIYYKLYNHVPDHSIFSKYGWEFCFWHFYKGKIDAYLGESEHLPCDEYGFGLDHQLEFKTQFDKDTSIVNEALRREIIKTGKITQENIDALRRIASFCQKKKIRFILITAPVSKQFYEGIWMPQKNLNTKIIQNLMKEYSCVKYGDYMMDTRFEYDDFYDCTHLSPQGATKFSKILSEDFNL